MQELIFQVEFKSDIVLPASSNTEGNIRQLDFIPGSNFLGMVAKNYDAFSDSFDIFHSGKVRFGDATLLVEEQELYKMPFSFFHPKLDENKIVHHHYLDLLDEKKRKELGQLKQMRSGYIYPNITNNELRVEYIDYNYAQKSAHDKTKRRSKKSSMYGYKAITAGTKWQFVVKYDESISAKDIELIKNTLENSKRLGKSKSAEYGQIEIKHIKEPKDSTIKSVESDKVILYVKSRISLVDKDGNPTYDLNYLLDGVEIDYPKCQIRTSTFTPYNRSMQTKTYERLVIEKGSVIVLKSLTPEQKKELEKGVGLYLSEGFGELLVNPEFLMKRGELSLFKKDKKTKPTDKRKYLEPNSTHNTVNFLINRHNSECNKLDLADEVAKFIDKNKKYFSKKMNAQWGTVRSLTLQAKDANDLEKLLFKEEPKEKPKGFLMSKRAKDKWNSNLVENIKKLRKSCQEYKQKETKKQELDYVQFIRLLAMDAPKQN